MHARIGVVVAWLFLVSCSSDEKPPVQVLGDDAQRKLVEVTLDPDDSTKGRVRFSPAPDELGSIAVGDKLVTVPVPPVAPYGFLYTVERIDRTNGDLVIDGVQPPLSEIIKEGEVAGDHTLTEASFDFDRSVTMAEAANAARYPGVAGARPFGLSVHWPTLEFSNVTALCDDPAPCNLSGSITLPDPQFAWEFAYDIQGWRRFMFQMTSNPQITLNVTGRLRSPGINLKEISLFSLYVYPFVVLVGPVPIVVTPRIDFKVKLDAALALDVQSATFSVGAFLRTGIDQVRGQPDRNLSSASGTAMATAVGGAQTTVIADIYSSIDGGIYIYNSFGPYTYFEQGPRLDFSTPRDPFFNLGYRVAMGMGGRVDIIDHRLLNLIDYSHDFFNEVIPIISSPNSAPSLLAFAPSLNAPPIPDAPCFSCGFNHCCIGITEDLPLSVDGYDLEDGVVSDAMVHWTSSNSADILGASGTNSMGKSIIGRFGVGGPGVRTVTATVTDSRGLPSIKSVLVRLPSAGPQVTLNSPSAVSNNFAFNTTAISGQATSPYFPSEVLCGSTNATFSWTSTGPDTFIGNSATSCSGSISWGSTGTRTITFQVTDRYGQVTQAQNTVNVVTAPSCIVSITTPDGSGPVVTNNGDVQLVHLKGTTTSGCAAPLNQYFTLTAHHPDGNSRTATIFAADVAAWRPSTQLADGSSLPLLAHDTTGTQAIDVRFTHHLSTGEDFTATNLGAITYQYQPE